MSINAICSMTQASAEPGRAEFDAWVRQVDRIDTELAGVEE